MVAAGLHCISVIPEGYTYVRDLSQTDNTASRQQAPSSVIVPFRSTGYVAHLNIADLKHNHSLQQSSASKGHDTLLTTHEGQVYTRP